MSAARSRCINKSNEPNRITSQNNERSRVTSQAHQVQEQRAKQSNEPEQRAKQSNEPSTSTSECKSNDPSTRRCIIYYIYIELSVIFINTMSVARSQRRQEKVHNILYIYITVSDLHKHYECCEITKTTGDLHKWRERV